MSFLSGLFVAFGQFIVSSVKGVNRCISNCKWDGKQCQAFKAMCRWDGVAFQSGAVGVDAVLLKCNDKGC